MKLAHKKAHVAAQGQTRPHTCHWPGCRRQVSPALWGCRAHWGQLPRVIRQAIWEAYRPGQESDGDPSPAYLNAVQSARDWAQRAQSSRVPDPTLHVESDYFGSDEAAPLADMKRLAEQEGKE